ncbi:NYN domain-containing protein [Brevundimonas sp.]|uniref:NYN domain-containing protein n=1 Tax=Brevundimonas sp. TaxID=1871086 RepID=UPI002D4D3C98|nr:NYN domain-containing protein [Brevundimonas sp.]HYC99557.1 NYN domain-containing protein [Brevundimonas sp.]
MIARTPQEIRALFDRWRSHRGRTLVAIDHSNVRRWQDALGWEVSVTDLGHMASLFAGHASLRRFYCAADFGPDWRSMDLRDHSKELITAATASGFEAIAKRVKYIREPEGYAMKCDLDIEIVTDLFAMKDAYDRIVLFSGDGDFVPALAHLNQEYGKEIVVIGAAGRIGREIFDAHTSGVVSTIIYADDLKHQLDGWWS